MPWKTIALTAALLGAPPARADVGIEAGARVGLDVEGADQVFVGGDVRLTFPASPLTINPTFDYFFVENGSLIRLGASALYHPPLGSTFRPYLGLGFGVNRFASEDGPPSGPPTAAVDDQGMRASLDLVAGARLELPVVKPYVQAMVGLGAIDLYAISVGVVTDFGRPRPPPATDTPSYGGARLVVSPYLHAHLAGDVEDHRGGVGVAVGYYRGPVGFEIDAAVHGHFFKDEEVADVVPDPMIDLNTRAIALTGNIVVPYRVRRAGLWTLYALAGAGVVRASFDAVGADEFDLAQTDPALAAGAGVAHALTRHAGIRVDVRYVSVFVGDSRTTGYADDYHLLRVSVGLTWELGL